MVYWNEIITRIRLHEKMPKEMNKDKIRKSGIWIQVSCPTTSPLESVHIIGITLLRSRDPQKRNGLREVKEKEDDQKNL